MDPLLDEITEIDARLAALGEQLAELGALLLLAGGRMRARGIEAGYGDYDSVHNGVVNVAREIARLRARHAPFAQAARAEECVEVA
mgnify:FL=1